MFTEFSYNVPRNIIIHLDESVEGQKLYFQIENGQKIFVYNAKLICLINNINNTLSFKYRPNFKGLKNTLIKVLNNAVNDVSEGYEKTIEIFYLHFPSRFEIKNNELILINLLGYKTNLTLKIPTNIEVELISPTSCKIKGYSRIDVMNYIHRIKRMKNRIRNRLDPRVFLDTIYHVS
jgi:ribosomal protein L6P/L9E